jgi:hypothetical protein
MAFSIGFSEFGNKWSLVRNEEITVFAPKSVFYSSPVFIVRTHSHEFDEMFDEINETLFLMKLFIGGFLKHDFKAMKTAAKK